MSPRREECRGCGAEFRPHPDNADACFNCFTLSRAATIRELDRYPADDDETIDEEERGA